MDSNSVKYVVERQFSEIDESIDNLLEKLTELQKRIENIKNIKKQHDIDVVLENGMNGFVVLRDETGKIPQRTKNVAKEYMSAQSTLKYNRDLLCRQMNAVSDIIYGFNKTIGVVMDKSLDDIHRVYTDLIESTKKYEGCMDELLRDNYIKYDCSDVEHEIYT